MSDADSKSVDNSLSFSVYEQKNVVRQINTTDKLLSLLSTYKTNLEQGTLSDKRRLLLLELECKDYLLQNPDLLPQTEPDLLKYAFLGAYIYAHLSVTE